jgi:hypothetical protein
MSSESSSLSRIERPHRKRGRNGSKDWRRTRLLWRTDDKERWKRRERWMKPSSKPGKKAPIVFTNRSHVMPTYHDLNRAFVEILLQCNIR